MVFSLMDYWVKPGNDGAWVVVLVSLLARPVASSLWLASQDEILAYPRLLEQLLLNF